jgi:hypothetical protein
MGAIKELLIQYTDYLYELILPYIDQDDPTVWDKCQDLIIQFASIKRNKKLIATCKHTSLYFDVTFSAAIDEFKAAINLPDLPGDLDFRDIYRMIDPAPFIDNYIR